MAHVVTEPCILCKYTDCVDVCPVDCFREGPNFLVIDPDECIDCAVCIPECPTNAIMAEEDVPEDQQEFIALNAELARTRTKPRNGATSSISVSTSRRNSKRVGKSHQSPPAAKTGLEKRFGFYPSNQT